MSSVCSPNTPKIQDDGLRPSSKNLKVTMSQQRFHRLPWNLARWRIFYPSPFRSLKFWNFNNQRWWRPPFWKKIEKSSYPWATVRPIATQFDTVTQFENDILDPSDRWNFEIWKIQDAGSRHFEKSKKSPYLSNRFIYHQHQIWYDDACWPSWACQPSKFSNFQNPRWWIPRPLFKKSKNRQFDWSTSCYTFYCCGLDIVNWA